MVGVPGRSKGCATCRRRKKGCDLQRPVCGQCKTAKTDCQWWDRQRIFVNATRTASSSSSSNSAMVFHGSTIAQSATVVELPNSLAATAYEDKYLGLFWDMYLPGWRTSENELMAQFGSGSWTTLARLVYHRDTAVKNALMAHCLATIGKQDQKPWLVDQSLKFYVRCLGDLKSRLYHPTRWRTDALVVASRGLASYEILYGREPKKSQSSSSHVRSWHNHSLGDEALVKQRSPWMHVDGDGHRLFVDGRMPLVISALMSRKASFLAEPDWKTIPFTQHPKSAKDLLVDVVADVPALLEDFDTFHSTLDERKFLQLIERFNTIHNGLTAWMTYQAPTAHLEALRRRNFTSPSPGDLAVVEAMSISWTAAILTYGALRMALHDAASSLHNTISIPVDIELSPRTDPRTYCKLVVEYAAIFFHPSAGIMFSKAAALPLGVALAYMMTAYGSQTEEVEKIVNYCSSDGKENSIGRFVKNSVREFPGPRVGVLTEEKGAGKLSTATSRVDSQVS